MTPQRGEPFELRWLVNHTRSQEHPARADRTRAKVTSSTSDRTHRFISKRHVGVLRQLSTRFATKLQRRDAVTTHEVVHMRGRRVAPRPPIHQEYALARARQGEGSLEARRS